MANVLVSFLGKGIPAGEAEVGPRYIGYTRVQYKFPPQNASKPEIIASALFGSALMTWLERCNQPVHEWLVMGTSGSMWDALIEAIPTEKWSHLDDLFTTIENAVKSEEVTQDDLNHWQQALDLGLPKTKFHCRQIGFSSDELSQLQMWAALESTIDEGDRVILDITNSFRHQPVIAMLMIMLLRRFKTIETFVYYGAFEQRPNKTAPCPVIRLPIATRLFNAAEAVATYQYTGSYHELGNCLDLPDQIKKSLEHVAFAEETNQQAKASARKTLNYFEKSRKRRDPIDQALIEMLAGSVRWVSGEFLGHRMEAKAKFAYRHGQYFKAVSLLWEAILISGCYKYKIAKPMEHSSRREAETELYYRLVCQDRESLQNVEHLRNAIVHGSQPNRKDVIRALREPEFFREIMDAGFDLLQSLLSE